MTIRELYLVSGNPLDAVRAPMAICMPYSSSTVYASEDHLRTLAQGIALAKPEIYRSVDPSLLFEGTGLAKGQTLLERISIQELDSGLAIGILNKIQGQRVDH